MSLALNLALLQFMITNDFPRSHGSHSSPQNINIPTPEQLQQLSHVEDPLIHYEIYYILNRVSELDQRPYQSLFGYKNPKDGKYTVPVSLVVREQMRSIQEKLIEKMQKHGWKIEHEYYKGLFDGPEANNWIVSKL